MNNSKKKKNKNKNDSNSSNKKENNSKKKKKKNEKNKNNSNSNSNEKKVSASIAKAMYLSILLRDLPTKIWILKPARKSKAIHMLSIDLSRPFETRRMDKGTL